MPVTMKDVAKKANLSLGTVSNYINGKASVKPDNKQKIEEAIEALGYQVNELARTLKTSSSMTIGVIVPSFGNVFAVRTISYLETIFRENNYSLQVSSYNNDVAALEAIITNMVAKRVDGLVIMPGSPIGEKAIDDINALVRKKTPVIIFDSINEGVVCDHVVLNNQETMRTITLDLINAGHKDIAFFLGPNEVSSSNERLNGYLQAHEEMKIPIDEDNIVFTDYSKSGSKELCISKLKDSKITAIMAAGYRITLGVLAAVEEKELKIPEDISVVGFDILDIADVLHYGLEGVYIPTKKLAQEITKTMLKRITEGFDDFPIKDEIKLERINGKSVKGIRR